MRSHAVNRSWHFRNGRMWVTFLIFIQQNYTSRSIYWQIFTCTIIANRRVSLAIAPLHPLQEARPLFAYSASKGKSWCGIFANHTGRFAVPIFAISSMPSLVRLKPVSSRDTLWRNASTWYETNNGIIKIVDTQGESFWFFFQIVFFLGYKDEMSIFDYDKMGSLVIEWLYCDVIRYSL